MAPPPTLSIKTPTREKFTAGDPTATGAAVVRMARNDNSSGSPAPRGRVRSHIRMMQSRPSFLAEQAPPSTTKNTIKSSKCHLLSLPPELRNRIYELVYLCAKQAELFDSDLLKTGSSVPSKALLLTCRQIRSEARLIYREVWDGLEFTLEQHPTAVERIRGTEEWRLERITRVRIVTSVSGSDRKAAVCGLINGVWMGKGLKWWPMGVKLVLLPRVRSKLVEMAGFKTETLTSTTLYRAVDVTGMDEDAVGRVKMAVGRKNLRKEELVAMVREARQW